MKKIILHLLLCFSALTLNAQVNIKDSLSLEVSKKLLPQIKNEIFKDTVAAYPSIIKITVQNKNQKAIITGINSTGNLNIFPDLNVIKSIDFSALLGDCQQIQIIYPIIVYTVNNSVQMNSRSIPVS